ncbi:MAG: CHAP domain-containing protein [Clostridia bacterium]|nr:CHAP domain-containing protein [Clostridia bacterium]
MKRKLAALCAALLLLAAVQIPTLALTPSHTVSTTYRASSYYKNLTQITRTGDPAFDAVAVALSQLGYHEGNSTADLGGKNAEGSRNYTEFNYALGTIGGTYGYAWCASFASWCLGEAGAAKSAGGAFASCTLWVEALREQGIYRTRSSGYKPKTGDLIFFRSSGTARASDHVGLVRYVKGNRVYTVEGNSSDRVSTRDYALSDTYIVGYGTPKYSGISLSLGYTALEDKHTGYYTVTNGFVNVRAAASSGAAKRGTLARGALVAVTEIQNGWGKITYNGATAYISLDYADYNSPFSFTVSYRAPEGEGAPAVQTYFSFERAAVAAGTPVREGYEFLAWSGSDGKVYRKGDALPQGNLTLTAMWEVLPAHVPESMPDGMDGDMGTGGVLDITPELNGAHASPTLDTVTPEQDASRHTAAVAAGWITGLLAAALAGLWAWHRFQIKKIFTIFFLKWH